MPDNLISVLLGVVSGVLTAFFLFIVTKLFNNSFLPWYSQLTYKGVHLEGKWFSYSASLQKTVLEIDQQCDQLKGKLTAILETDVDVGIDSIRTFDVVGNVKDRFITLNLYHTDKTRIGIATILVQVEGDGTVLNGKLSSYSPVVSKIVSNQTSYFRNESRAKEARKKAIEAQNVECYDSEHMAEESGFFSDQLTEEELNTLLKLANEKNEDKTQSQSEDK